MKDKVQKIKLNGLDFILTSPNGNSSPVATVKAYKKMECSYAHYYKEGEGRIVRFGDLIGTTSDIEFGETIEVDIDPLDAMVGLMGDTWPV